MVKSKKSLKNLVVLASMVFVCIIISSCGDSDISKQKLESGLYPMYEKGSMQDRWGYVDETGEYVIQPQYSYADKFYEGMAVACDLDTGLYGYIDSFGEWAIPPQFDWASGFVNGYAVVSVNYSETNGEEYTIGYKDGCINSYGEIFLEPIYDSVMIEEQNPGKFIISKDGQTYERIDEDFGVLSVMSAEEYGELSNELLLNSWRVLFYEDEIVRLNKNGEKETIDYKAFNEALEKEDISVDDCYVDSFQNGMCAVMEDYYDEDSGYEGCLYGYIDSDFKLVTEVKFFTFDEPSRFDDGIALVRTLPDEEGLVSYGYIGKDGKWLIKKQYSGELDSYDMYY